MRAAIYETTGAAQDVLNVVELPVPEPGPGEVRVRVIMSGVNPTDWKSRSPGSRIEAPDGTGLIHPYQIPNQDGAGTIDAVGEGVDFSRVGERVWVFLASNGGPQGTAAEYVCVPQERAMSLPEGVSFAQGAGLGVPFITAHRCMFANGQLAGRTVLVTGGAGAVGHAALQLGRRTGARLLATVSSDEKARLAEEAGADVTLDYRSEEFTDQILAAAPEGIDHVVDVALGANFPTYAQALVNGAFVASYAASGSGRSSRQLSLPHGVLMDGNVTLNFVLLYTLEQESLTAAARGVNDALVAGELTPHVEHRFSLEEIAEAHEALEQGAVGKVLVEV